jgi:nitrogen-specific signal transduction histidine kinase
MIVDIAVALRRAKSLLSIHLCGNKGVTERSKAYVRERIHAKTETAKKSFRPTDLFHKLKIPMMGEAQVLKMQLARGGEKEGEKPVARESIKLKQIFDRKRLFSKEHQFTEEPNDTERLICTRVLNHKQDIPGIGQWKVITDKSEKCWICDQ